VNYVAVARWKSARLRRAFQRFQQRRGRREERRLRAFCERNRGWLDDYALFCALKGASRGAPWTAWPQELRIRRRSALRRCARRLAEELRYHQFLQFLFHEQWEALHRRCRQRGVGLIGDIPFYVAHDSAEVWTHQELFWLDRFGNPKAVAGVPPDYFSRTGQLWGNPVYRWSRLRQQGYAWWLERLRANGERFDAVRLDHFIGFHRSWQVPAGARTARKGRFVPGPGAAFLHMLRRRFGGLQVIVEDLGTLTPEVEALRDRFGFPGMRVLQFAFGEGPRAEESRPHNVPRRCVVYPATHDNDTTVGWFRGAGSSAGTRSNARLQGERAVALRYLGSRGHEIHWDMIRLAMMSVADTVISPMQDLLGLGSEARMNVPGTVGRNWQWRLREEALTPELQHRLRDLTDTYGRLPT
jgi:4-alpha-glucanotransferase